MDKGRETDWKERAQHWEKAHGDLIQTILVALLLLEKGDTDAAKKLLINHLPGNLAHYLAEKQP